jgi:hypothetical protein
LSRDGSQRPGAAGSVLLQSLFGQSVETSSSYILLELAIPGSRIERQEPGPEACEFLWGEAANGALKLSCVAHAYTIIEAHATGQGQGRLGSDGAATTASTLDR